MKVGIVDIGSNTIRLVVYDVIDMTYKEILNQRSFAGIIEYVDDDRLSQTGMDKLVKTLSNIKELTYLVRCDKVFYFATASLRGLNNSIDLLTYIKKELDIDIDIITGEEEAYFDYVSLKNSKITKTGLGIDLGGGSCQVFAFDGDNVEKSNSFRIGSLLLYKTFVSSLFPKEREKKAIKNYVLAELEKSPELKKLGFTDIYAMGGTARAAIKLHRVLAGSSPKVKNNYALTVEQIDEMIDTIYDMGKDGIKLLCHVIPERVYTIIPGLIAIKAICQYTGAKGIIAIKSSVREGYLTEKVIKK